MLNYLRYSPTLAKSQYESKPVLDELETGTGLKTTLFDCGGGGGAGLNVEKEEDVGCWIAR